MTCLSVFAVLQQQMFWIIDIFFIFFILFLFLIIAFNLALSTYYMPYERYFVYFLEVLDFTEKNWGN